MTIYRIKFQAACQAEINNLYDAAGALIIDCATITDATAKAACETNQKTIAKKLAGFGTSGGLLGKLPSLGSSDFIIEKIIEYLYSVSTLILRHFGDIEIAK